MNHSADEKSSPASQATRLKRLRTLANLSRKEVSDQYGIKLKTYINWEQKIFKKCLPKNAVLIAKAMCDDHAISFTREWLLFGIGSEPTMSEQFDEKQNAILKNSIFLENKEEERIIKELLSFRKYYKDTLELKVEDDGMSPKYQPGEYIAGIRYHKSKIESLIGLDCIVQISDGQMLLRNIKEKTENDRYTLICTNVYASIKEVVLYNVELINAAPVVWHRCKNIW
ncbi:MAG: hypothetical protein COB66_08130 [Coxiella sp. (in: Bacteria)]|nr:MAG: hypothetical protein COB66_08130 [Coxiella sp. (in: g-proteobacteria)]